jgi:hypothetical protein
MPLELHACLGVEIFHFDNFRMNLRQPAIRESTGSARNFISKGILARVFIYSQTTNFGLDRLRGRRKKNKIFSSVEQRALKNVSNCLTTNIYSYLETSGGQSSNLCLNVVHFFNTSVNKNSVAA